VLGFAEAQPNLHGLLFSAGDMAIGGALDADHQATGQATTLNNNSATIEALGSLAISTATLGNTNLHFATAQGLTSQTTFSGYNMGEWCSSLYNQPGCTGNYYEDHTEHTYTQSVYTPTVTQSDPGKIYAGGNMSLTGNTITNDKSVIVAGGTLSGNLGNLNNIGAQGTQTTVLQDDYKVWMGESHRQN
jgi:filamentous hemagglutinin